MHAPALLALMSRPCVNHPWEDGKFVNDDGKPICKTCARN